jgi:GAF domain-containing protein/HAMP domain-containing protein
MDTKDSDLKKPLPNITPTQMGVFSIANQLRYGLALLIILSLLITAGWLIYLAFQTQVQQLEVAQRERSRAAAGEINTYVDDLQRKLSYLARVRGLTDLALPIQEDMLDGLLRHNDAYERVAILDRTGQVLIALPDWDQTTSRNLAGTPIFLRAFKQQEDYIGPVEINPVTGLPEATLAVPIRNRQDKVEGVLLARINLKFLWYVVSETKVGETGYVYVLDNRNFLIAEKGSKAETFNLEDISERPFIQNLISGTADRLAPYQGLKGQNVLGTLAPIRSLHWNVVVELPTAEAYAPIIKMFLFMGIVLSLATLATIGLGIYVSWQIVQPLQRLTEASAQISAGNMETQVMVNSRNEMGILAATFNQMTTQLKNLYMTLEQQVTSRTQRLEVLATLGERLNSILNQEELLSEVVNQIKDNFGYYHAQIYLLDDKGENLVVAAGTGEAGADMKARGHSIRLDALASLVARAARTDEIVWVDNVREAPDWLPNPLLPETYSEMAVPIISEEQVVGVLDVQQDRVAGLDEGDASLLRSLAGQVAIAVRNARLFTQTQAALDKAQSLQRLYMGEAWERLIATRPTTDYEYRQGPLPPLSEITTPEAVAALQQGQTVRLETERKQVADGKLNAVDEPAHNPSSAPIALATPLKLRDEVIGILGLHAADSQRSWTEDEIALVESVSEQMALAIENARLFEDTQRSAWRDQMVSETTAKVWSSAEIEEVLKTAVAQLGDKLRASEVVIRLGTEAELAQTSPE